MTEDGLGIVTSILTNHSSDVTVIYSQSLATFSLKQNPKKQILQIPNQSVSTRLVSSPDRVNRKAAEKLEMLPPLDQHCAVRPFPEASCM